MSSSNVDQLIIFVFIFTSTAHWKDLPLDGPMVGSPPFQAPRETRPPRLVDSPFHLKGVVEISDQT